MVCAPCVRRAVSQKFDGLSKTTGKMHFWRCNNSSCKKKISPRHGSLFEHSHLSLENILLVIYYNYWLYGVSQVLKIECKNTLIHWFHFCINIRVEILLKKKKIKNKNIEGPNNLEKENIIASVQLKIHGFWGV